MPDCRRLLSLVLVGALILALAGCDGEGVFIKGVKAVDGDDTPDDDDAEPDPIPDDEADLGTWIAGYGDDKAEAGASRGAHQYAAVTTLKRDGTQMTGTGTVYRVFESGTTASDKLSIKLTGTISGDDATLSVTSATGGEVADMPTWRLRFAGKYLVGAYRSVNSSNQQMRTGHTVWHKVSTASLNGAWVTAYSDVDGTTAMPARDRTAAMVLTHDTATQTLSGTGSIVEQRPGDIPEELDFNIVRSKVQAPQLGFSMGDLDMASNEIDWFGMYTSSIVVDAYAQYDLADRLVRAGHGMWYAAADAGPTAVNATWATSFCDAGYGTGVDPSCYLFSVKLAAGEGNVVTGTGQMIDGGFDITSFHTVRAENGTIVGSHVKVDMRVPVTGDVFSWDLRVAGSVMVGSYQRRDGSGQYLSSGTAEWRKERATPSPKGTWAASYYDALGGESQPLTQFVLVNVSGQADDGTLSGNGALRFMNGETGRRLFNLVSSSLDGKDVQWVWRGTDLFGDTTWRLRHAGDFLFGIYENLTANGNFESLGSAVWIRTSSTTSL